MIPDEYADDERGFEACDLPPGRFRHLHHVLVTWHYARTREPLAGLSELIERLRAFSAAQGVPDRYHETVTYAWFFLVRERLERTGRDAPWEAFAEANPDLLDGTAVERYYKRETLYEDPFARRVFVLPDRPLEEDPPS
ncbi:MAG: hypothetical protein R3326_09910 [Gemmatimonadota bacterium]|nr:hypothetical protein [Gemmatimonadota bacterium]